ncbi:hypothetical protein J7T55_010769 [Diaporthe amygdali]|uniref:uncharacterized protein n=1 Tax=Phomopsis amygdali TaxID=1214568 RepID=UPI0022FE8B01|nr:uncharacterized protein J7T55_010769 [Diaporthe amygdali]KAJ0114380.1 hypothetical protein J7T55_010769 [Diaporthe amygdali]
MARARRIVVDSSDDDFPELRDLGRNKAEERRSNGSSASQTESLPSKSTVRRRKLGAMNDNTLLRPKMDRGSSRTIFDDDGEEFVRPRRTELRNTKSRPVVKSVELDNYSDTDSMHEETIIEDFHDDDGSEFEASRVSGSDESDFTADEFLPRSPSKSKRLGTEESERRGHGQAERSPSPSAQLLSEAIEAQERDGDKAKGRTTSRKANSKSRDTTPSDLTRPLSKLNLHELKPPRSQEPSSRIERPTTPTSPPPQPRTSGLMSPSKKIPRIPATPHHSTAETFWNQEFIDEWNDEHSPKKQLFLPSVGGSPSKKHNSPSKKCQPSAAALAKAAKKAFEQSKRELADKFLRELDTQITDGKISELSAPTGGIRIDWTNKLNTTAGRANWKRETIKRKDGDSGAVTSVRYKHHASIELAEKVIDDESRLLNVIAHEFCHLANFMVSGVTTNPHGREFKAWAAKVTARFGGRGIEVTTKHSYDIDFKYVWECTACALEFKRHSKSINPERHRCGACKSELKQTKPMPRGKPGKESDYQKFMKEQMKLIKQENPASPQKDIMKMVATRWSQEKDMGSGDKKPSPSSQCSNDSSGKPHKVEGVARAMDKLTLIDLT